jgi:hypothetical protein
MLQIEAATFRKAWGGGKAWYVWQLQVVQCMEHREGMQGVSADSHIKRWPWKLWN